MLGYTAEPLQPPALRGFRWIDGGGDEDMLLRPAGLYPLALAPDCHGHPDGWISVEARLSTQDNWNLEFAQEI